MDEQPSIWSGLKGAAIYCAFAVALYCGGLWLYPRMGKFGVWLWSVF